jgi:hypothetical protein
MIPQARSEGSGPGAAFDQPRGHRHAQVHQGSGRLGGEGLASVVMAKREGVFGADPEPPPDQET